MAWQTIAGLSVIVLLLGMFGVLIYKKVQDRNALAAKALKEQDGENSKQDGTAKTGSDATKGKIVLAAGNGESADKTDPFTDPVEAPATGKKNGHPAKEFGTSKHAAKSSPKKTEIDELGGLEGLEAEPRESVEKSARGTPSLDGSSPGKSLAGSAKPSNTDDLQLDSQEEPDASPLGAKTGSRTANSRGASGKQDDLFANDTKSPAQPLRGGHTLPTMSKKPIASTEPSSPFDKGEEEPAPEGQPLREKSGLPTVSIPSPQRSPATSTQLPVKPKSPVNTDDLDELPLAKTHDKPELPKANSGSATPRGEPKSSDKLGDFVIANDPPPKKIPIESAAPIKPIPATSKADPRLEGFEVVEEDTTRATSKTIVQRPPEMLRKSSGISLTEVSGKQPGAVPTPLDDEEPLSVAPRRQPVPNQVPANPVASRTPTPIPESAHNPGDESYTVAPSDNYWMISRKQYGSGRYFQALAEYNKGRIADPNRMRPGTVIATPAREVLEKKYPQLIDKAPAATQPAAPKTTFSTGSRSPDFSSGRTFAPATSRESASASAGDGGAGGFFTAPSGQPMYRVGEADMLTNIAQRHLGRASRWAEIFELNKEAIHNPDALKIGTVIRLPSDASRVGFVSEGSPRR